MSGVFYLKGILLNVLLTSTAFACMRTGLSRILFERWLDFRSRVMLEWPLTLACILAIAFCLLVVDRDLQWSPGFDFVAPTAGHSLRRTSVDIRSTIMA